MEYRSSFDRINNVRNIEEISKKVCEDYGFNTFIKYNVIEIGYEDFNYILSTTKQKYMVKIFNKDRDVASCTRLIKIISKVINEGINHPKIYKDKTGKYIYNIQAQGVELQLIVMEYVEGNNLYELDEDLGEGQLNEIAKTAAKINSIDFQIKETFYDEWTVTNLIEEYEKKKSYLDENDRKVIEEIVNEFKMIDWSKFNYAYIHGDIIKANIIKGNDGKLYFIDFSAFNYLPRVIECVVILLGDCLTDSRGDTINKMRNFLKYYNKYNSLEKIEKESLNTILNALAAMYVIQASYIKKGSQGDYVENEYWLNQGRKYLKMSIKKEDLFK